MYFSRVELHDNIDRSSQLSLVIQEQNYSMHRLLWDLFADRSERFLFREEQSRKQRNTRHNAPIFYVLSHSPPQDDSALFKVSTKNYQPQLKKGDKLAFKLRANPIVAKKIEGQKNSKKHDIVMNAQAQWLQHACQERNLDSNNKKSALRKKLLTHTDFSGPEGKKNLDECLKESIDTASRQWLEQRAEKNGFHINTLQCTGYRWHGLPNKGRKAGFSSMDYEGLLSVHNADLFYSLLCQGVGASKAFGCGLMLVRRHR